MLRVVNSPSDMSWLSVLRPADMNLEERERDMPLREALRDEGLLQAKKEEKRASRNGEFGCGRVGSGKYTNLHW